MSGSADATTQLTLSSATLPRRVRRLLEHVLALVSDEMARHIGQMFGDYEQQLFRLADHARNPTLQAAHLDTLRTVRLNRSDLVPRYLVGLESALAGIREQARRGDGTSGTTSSFGPLSLLDDSQMDEATVLHDVATRHEARASLPLYLLGQRFGVLAGAPAFDAEHLPIGPRGLCLILQEASRTLPISLEARLLLYRSFDRHVMKHFGQIAEMANAALASEGVLPGLAYVPIRIRPGNPHVPMEDDEARDDGRDEAGTDDAEGGTPRRRGRAQSRDGGKRRPRARQRRDEAHSQRPHTAWLGEADANDDALDESAAFALLQQLLSGRRDLIGKLRPGNARKTPLQLSTEEVVDALDDMQAPSTSPTGNTRNLLDIKQALLAQARQARGKGASLSRDDSDTFELLSMLYGQIEREMRDDAPASGLLARLQVPMLRVALQDRGFFVRPQHPARQLLNAVAESGARWLEDDESDPQLVEQLRNAVDHVVANYHGDAKVFETANRDLQSHLHTLARKAEMTERRHVEAARGKEKLELAKRRAAEAIEAEIRDRRLPKFVRALLNQAWADVLTLVLLRQGESSDEWKRMLEATRRIVSTTASPGADPDNALSEQIEGALVQVGYHNEEAAAIARRLTTGLDDDDDDPASRTELAMKLKARGRLGADAMVRKPKLPPRNADEQAAYEQLRTLPFGVWFEFMTNQQGDVVRRRLSWYSPVTDNALFVNQRGQRVGEQSLDSLARMLAKGQVRLVTADRGHVVDRAWQAALNALRSFAGRGAGADPAPAGGKA